MDAARFDVFELWAARTSHPPFFRDGKLIVQGGEYNFCNPAETTLGAIYDPVANSWTSVAAPGGWSCIGDGESVVLDEGPT